MGESAHQQIWKAVSMAQSEHKDNYLATGITLLAIGGLFMLDKFLHFASHGYGWLMDKSNLLLFAAIVFLLVKREKTVGILLLLIWAIINIGLIVNLLGQLSGYLLPLALLVIGIVLLYMYRR